ncbi:hypothetical protein BH24ACT5_BH24ACT5_24680 [soil metagenome]
MTDAVHRLVDIATGQHGAITPRQASLVGVTPRQLRSRVQSGILQSIGTHVVRSPFVEATPLADLAALVIDCGRGAVASGVTAAALHGLDGFKLQPPFHVTVPRGRIVHRTGHRIHTTSALPDVDRTRVHGIAAMAAARTLFDLARTQLELCADYGLPRPESQVILTATRRGVVRVDFRFAGTPVVVEVLGYQFHRGSRAQLAQDAERLNELVMSGIRPLQFTYEHVTLEPGWVMAKSADALAAAA